MRYAIYFAPPPRSPWWEFGTRWLGRDECTDQPREQPSAAGLDDETLRTLTRAPRRYGFHATLKAPFRLREGVDEATLLARVDAVAATLAPKPLTPLVLAVLDDFLALTPADRHDGVDAIAAACVTGLDDLRALLTPEESAARRGAGLDARQEELLARFGYPHVLDRFRFHMTLTGAAPAGELHVVREALHEAVEHLNVTSPLMLDRLCVFIEPRAGAALVRRHDVLLGSSANRSG